ncbi:MAG: hypothetical protein KHY44_01505 [Clostridiales bacterium]|nr:hypothetical protein [Clostridiales bacterium]
MKSTIKRFMESKKTGLLAIELPTGYGKTYNVVQCIKEYIEKNPDRKIFFITTLTKNLPINELKKVYKSEQEYDNDVLVLRSNLEQLKEKLLSIDVPTEFHTDTYRELCKKIRTVLKAEGGKNTDRGYITFLENDIRLNLEVTFRREVMTALKKHYHTKEEKLKAIQANPKYHWIGQLYPAVYTDTHKIYLLSMDKFLVKNTTLIESSYEFISSDKVENAIIFIDEFDATKDTIKNAIIKKALDCQEDYIELFKQIMQSLSQHVISQKLESALLRNSKDNKDKEHTLEKIVSEGKSLVEKYSLNHSYKTVLGDIDQRQSFIFNDGAFHTLLRGDNKYIRTEKDEDDKRVNIYFENKEAFYKNQKQGEENIVIYNLIRDINSFLNRFRYFILNWAERYMQQENTCRAQGRDKMNKENAIESILSIFLLSRSQQKLLLGEFSGGKLVETNDGIPLGDMSFYQRGFRFYEFEDDDRHNDHTIFRYVKVEDTPEKIILNLAKRATVIGISATATIPTVVGNYDIEYLRSKLGNRFHELDKCAQERIKSELQKVWEPYEEGKVVVHVRNIDSNKTYMSIDERLEEIIKNEEFREICKSRIEQSTYGNRYYAKRYCNILAAMHEFISHQDIQSFLCLNMAIPSIGKPEFDEQLLKDLMELLIEDNQNKSIQVAESFFILAGNNFETDKQKLIKKLEEGKKVFIMSSYKTIGAGQNLQYPVKNKKKYVELCPYKGDGDQRHFYKDMDALYLGDVTNMAVNTNQVDSFDKVAMLKLFFQSEELYQNNEINFAELEKMIKLGFKTYTKTQTNVDRDFISYNKKGIRMQATQMILQAVGRICRTFIKNPNVYIYLEESLLHKIDVNELNKRIISPEMKKIANLCEALGNIYTEEQDVVLNKAEHVSSFGKFTIMRILSRNWNEASMQLWSELRRDVLMYPTAAEDIYLSNRNIRELYVTSGIPMNRYLFSQYSDFSDVVIDFSNDRLCFKNSNRLKKKGESEEGIICEVSEEEVRLKEILRYKGLKEYFNENGYATCFKEAEYMLSPILFQNIYKGALGEVAGKYILENELGVRLKEIIDSDKFEFFDYELAPNVYIDFKHWKFGYTNTRENIKKEIRQKMDVINAKRVYIINIMASDNYAKTEQVDERIIEIPRLLNKDGKIDINALKMIKMEDLE